MGYIDIKPPKNLKWSKEKPTEEGYYWARNTIREVTFEEIVVVMRLAYAPKSLFIQTFDGGLDSVDGYELWDNNNTEWAKVYGDV